MHLVTAGTLSAGCIRISPTADHHYECTGTIEFRDESSSTIGSLQLAGSILDFDVDASPSSRPYYARWQITAGGGSFLGSVGTLTILPSPATEDSATLEMQLFFKLGIFDL
mmetsp:Transcript_33630/g.52263  ORF Transcript_33630/g.52263 Transcript_33630/m.52263 type:complete len:111 (-) Transcript_33630:190-522(-)